MRVWRLLRRSPRPTFATSAGGQRFPTFVAEGRHEIDLLAIDPVGQTRYHIEVSVSISSGFSKLTARPFSEDRLKDRVGGPSPRRTIGFFLARKLDPPEVLERLAAFGFEAGGCHRCFVTWGWTDEAATAAADNGIELWDMRQMLLSLSDRSRRETGYLADDTMRTIHLVQLAIAGSRP